MRLNYQASLILKKPVNTAVIGGKSTP